VSIASSEQNDCGAQSNGGGKLIHGQGLGARSGPPQDYLRGRYDNVTIEPFLAYTNPTAFPSVDNIRFGCLLGQLQDAAPLGIVEIHYRQEAVTSQIGSRQGSTIVRRPENAKAAALDWPTEMHPVLKQVLSRRPVSSLEELSLRLADLRPVGRFTALEAAVDLLASHKEHEIVIVGDFDSDGATSTALMSIVLRALGFERVGYFIPDRFELGYGLTPGAVARVAERGPALVVTVDNGISSVDGVRAARARGIDVLITDHHSPPAVLPSANAIVNPNLPGDDFGGHNLAGVGVVFYLLAALARALGSQIRISDYLDLVALGTVADLVVLDHANRILVNEGIRRIRAGLCRPGIRALCEASGVALGDVDATTLGYQIGPRLNAAGRLEDMSIGVRCLLETDQTQARALAAQLDSLNRQRRSIEAKMRADAMAIIDELDATAEGFSRHVVCLFQESWHEGLVGLIASRVKDRCGRPAFAFAPAVDGRLKGSGRSIRGFHLRDALAAVDAEHPGLIDRFGGHAMAAGLTLERDGLAQFETAIEQIGARLLSAEQMSQKVLTDGELPPEYLGVDVARMLGRAGPWGQGFPEPTFDGLFKIVDMRWLKDAHLKMSVRSSDDTEPVDAIAFNCDRADVRPEQTVQLAYRLAINDYFATPRVQLVIEHLDAI